MDKRTHRLIGINLIVTGILLLLLLLMFPPYCATHTCGCTDQGKQWAMLMVVPVLFILGGVFKLFR